ncbi:MAG: carbohydrate-binding protein, partial [Bacteroidetes bacterium]|nr:carbohydrate-binding protein [Bacteroidota bacterium]
DQIAIAQGHKMADISAASAKGLRLINENVCKSCHTIGQTSIGPAYQKVAEKYETNEETINMLAKKVMEGGSGVWGEAVMPANPQVEEADVKEMIRYILSLDEEKAPTNTLPVQGTFDPKEAKSNNYQGVFIARAVYTDKGANGMPPATSEEVFVLRSPQISPGKTASDKDINRFSFGPREILIAASSGSYLGYEAIDFTNITSITFTVSANSRFSRGGKIEVHIDAPDGPKIGETPMIKAKDGEFTMPPDVVKTEITKTEGWHELYVVFVNEEDGQQALMSLSGIEFGSDKKIQ